MGCGKPTAPVPRPIVVPGAKGSTGKIVSRLPPAPPRVAGLLQRMSNLAGSVGSKPPRVRPKRASAGTGALKVEKPITQPICFAFLQAGTLSKSPPLIAALLDVDLAAEQVGADERLRTPLRLSIRSAISCRRMKEPCEWPIRMIPRPLLYFFR